MSKKAKKDDKNFSPIEIAALCHEVERIYERATGDYKSLPWIDTPGSEKTAKIQLVKDILCNTEIGTPHSRLEHIQFAIIEILRPKKEKPLTPELKHFLEKTLKEFPDLDEEEDE